MRAIYQKLVVQSICKITRFSSSVRQCIDYAKIIHEKFVKRELNKISENLSDESMDEST